MDCGRLCVGLGASHRPVAGTVQEHRHGDAAANGRQQQAEEDMVRTVKVARPRGPFKSQAPNPKLQRHSQPPKIPSSVPESDLTASTSGSLGVGNALGFGPWALELADSPRIPHPGRHPVDRDQQRPPERAPPHRSSVLSAVRAGHCAQPAQQLDLEEVDRIDVGIAHVDRPAQHRVLLEQEGVSGDLQHRLYRRGPAARAARAPSSRRSSSTTR